MAGTEAYKYEEYSADSETIPGIVSTYKTHIVFVNIKDRTRTELQRIGLPNGKDFTTQDGKTKWTWTPVVNSKEDDLMQLLQKNGIDISEFTWQSFVELYTEVYEDQCVEPEACVGHQDQAAKRAHTELAEAPHVVHADEGSPKLDRSCFRGIIPAAGNFASAAKRSLAHIPLRDPRGGGIFSQLSWPENGL
eukprot:symbB.v1.2.009807.t1/scaffold614.1/size180566/17